MVMFLVGLIVGVFITMIALAAWVVFEEEKEGGKHNGE